MTLVYSTERIGESLRRQTGMGVVMLRNKPGRRSGQRIQTLPQRRVSSGRLPHLRGASPGRLSSNRGGLVGREPGTRRHSASAREPRRMGETVKYGGHKRSIAWEWSLWSPRRWNRGDARAGWLVLVVIQQLKFGGKGLKKAV